MEEAPFELVGLVDASATEIVVGVPSGGPVPTYQFHHLVADRLVEMPGAITALSSRVRVLALDDLYADAGNDIGHYDGSAFSALPITGAPPYEERYDLQWDVRPATGEVFVVMTSRWETGVLSCRGNLSALACAPSGLPVAPSQLVATGERLYYLGADWQLYELLADGRPSLLFADVRRITRAGSDRLLVQTATTSLVLADDGSIEDLGAGSFHAVGSAGAILRLEVTSAFEDRDCPSYISCAPGHGYTQFVLYRREGPGFVEHAHLDLIDEYADQARLLLLPDGRIALTPNLVPGTFVAPPLP